VTRRLLRTRRERPRRRSAEQADELAPSQLIELHSVPCQPGPDCRLSHCTCLVSGWAVPGVSALSSTGG